MTTTTSSAEPIPVIPLTTPPDPTLLSQLVTLHQQSILHDHALMRFHPPFTPAKTTTMTTWWRHRLSDAGHPSHHVFLAFSPPTAVPLLTSGAPTSPPPTLVGVVELLTPASDTGHFRAEVEMLMVAPGWRGRGLARRLMAEVEGRAREVGRSLLVLSTTRESEADRYLYPRLGYVAFGVLPEYGERPDGSGERVDGVYYYKDLRTWREREGSAS
ncbi:uncharacterized protein HMPREF1541_09499 [Cyphellophora europaea CBS 101466]|uniref:N-acetyltransferase domain-containing protein n=1 Tax=Cyphellophora europaea (strain CBS 101466) TaxID=1220924 RepID=W2SAB1_CYPE1|nr:uncharacterized protein HMPREF1541_09499 [Cyphellophora europaea CBS 101466]ETN45666.1 hypothetical protein HMPREF1541_09499 [Cyphellophora europaea CBS 101466]